MKLVGKRFDIAFWVALIGTAALILALVAARGAAAQTPLGKGAGPSGPAVALAFHPVEEDEEGEGEENEGESNLPVGRGGGVTITEADECESDDEEAEERCEERLEREEEKEEAEEQREVECRVEGAEATVTAVPGKSEVKLTVRYLTYQPSAVAVELRMRGAKGSLDLGVEGARFALHGTLHAQKELSAPEMARVRAAKEFTVGIHAKNAPRFCRGLFERHLTSRHGLHWSDPTAPRRAKEAARNS